MTDDSISMEDAQSLLDHIESAIQSAESFKEKGLFLPNQKEDLETLTFHDLFDLDEVQKIQDHFAKATGVASIITDPDGHPITRPSNFSRLCSEIIRKTEKGQANCFRSDAAIGKNNLSGPVVRPCLSGGLWDAGAGIRVGRHHLANWLVGQVRNETQTEEAMRHYARTIGADETEVVDAFYEVPSMPLDQFKTVAKTVFLFANQLSAMAWHNHRQLELIQELHLIGKQLKEQRRRYELATEAGKITLWEWFPETNRLQHDPLFWRSMGYSMGEVFNNENLWIDIIHRKDLDKVRDAAYACAEGREPIYDLQHRIVDKEGNIRWVHVHGRMIDGNARMVGTLMEITEQKRSEQRLQQAQKMEAMGTLAGGIAHDFNNILFPILGFAEMVKEMPDDPEMVKTAIDQIYNSGMRAKELVNQILTFSRQHEQEVSSINLKPLIKEAVKLLRSSIPSSVEITLSIEKNFSSQVQADATQMHQVVMNLVTNAYHAIPDKMGSIRISLDTHTMDETEAARLDLQKGKYVRLGVTDTGRGISKAVRERMFEPYFTTKAEGQGTGLGLSIVHGIVQNAQGRIFVESEEGCGTTFQVCLPAVDRQVKQAPLLQSQDLPKGNGERILLVDDDRGVLHMEQMMLNRLGYDVMIFSDSREALTVIQNELSSFDLLISDMTMPRLTGIALVEAANALCPDFPAIICTGLMEEMDPDRCRGLRIQAILSKPVSFAELARTVRQVFDHMKRQ